MLIQAAGAGAGVVALVTRPGMAPCWAASDYPQPQGRLKMKYTGAGLRLMSAIRYYWCGERLLHTGREGPGSESRFRVLRELLARPPAVCQPGLEFRSPPPKTTLK